MAVINFSKANCKNCYRCVRECPVKSIRVKDEQAEIVEELCIACGNCLRVCPQNAKEVKSELGKIRKWIFDKEQCVVSLAPAFASIFGGSNGERTAGALKKLGFAYVEETSAAAYRVSQEYQRYYDSSESGLYITTSCPSANYLVEKYYPSLIKNMIPVKSPMALHAVMLKEKYGRDTKVVFIGPCLAKKLEAGEEKFVDGVLTFEELERWLRDEEIDITKADKCEFDNAGEETARLYPVIGGINSTIKKGKREFYKADGITECIDILGALQRGEITDGFVEINICSGSCINGPAMPEKIPVLQIRKKNLKEYAESRRKEEKNKSTYSGDMGKIFDVRIKARETPSDESIRRILIDIGKNSPADELNCGACGYNSCRDKAKAVFLGMAEKYMCLPYMRHRAEMMTNTIFDNTPGIIFILNNSLEIIELNPAAKKIFAINRHEAVGKKISVLMNDSDFCAVLESGINIVSKKSIIPNYGITVIKSVIKLNEQDALLVIMHDITDGEKRDEELKNIKMKTIDMAQEVINKQMRVAQEIASLLGETTAETKVTLTRLKKLVQGDEGGLK